MTNCNDLKQKSISSFLWKFFERCGYQAVQLVVQIFLARLISPSDFGALAIIIVFINLSNCFVQSGLNTALIQAKNVKFEDYSTVFWFSFLVSILLFCALFFCAPLIASFYVLPQIVWPMRVLGLLLLTNAYNAVQVAKITRDLEFAKLFKATMASVFVSGAIGICLACFGTGIWALVIQQIVFQACSCVLLSFQVAWHPHFVFNCARAKAFFSFGWKLLLSSLLDQGYQGMYDLVVGKVYSPLELGYFNQGKKFPQTIVGLFDGSIQSVMLSAISKMQDNVAMVKQATRRSMMMSAYVVAPVMALLAAAASPLVSLLLTDKWIEAVPFLQIMCISYALWPLHTSNLQAINAMGRSDAFLKLEVVKKIVGVITLLLAIVIFENIYAVALSSVVAGFLSLIINAFPSKKIFGYRLFEQIKDIAPSYALACLAGVLAWCVSLLALSHVLTVVLELLIVGFVYIGFSQLLHLEAYVYFKATAKKYFLLRREGKTYE